MLESRCLQRLRGFVLAGMLAGVAFDGRICCRPWRKRSGGSRNLDEGARLEALHGNAVQIQDTTLGAVSCFRGEQNTAEREIRKDVALEYCFEVRAATYEYTRVSGST